MKTLKPGSSIVPTNDYYRQAEITLPSLFGVCAAGAHHGAHRIMLHYTVTLSPSKVSSVLRSFEGNDRKIRGLDFVAWDVVLLVPQRQHKGSVRGKKSNLAVTGYYSQP